MSYLNTSQVSTAPDSFPDGPVTSSGDHVGRNMGAINGNSAIIECPASIGRAKRDDHQPAHTEFSADERVIGDCHLWRSLDRNHALHRYRRHIPHRPSYGNNTVFRLDHPKRHIWISIPGISGSHDRGSG